MRGEHRRARSLPDLPEHEGGAVVEALVGSLNALVDRRGHAERGSKGSLPRQISAPHQLDSDGNAGLLRPFDGLNQPLLGVLQVRLDRAVDDGPLAISVEPQRGGVDEEVDGGLNRRVLGVDEEREVGGGAAAAEGGESLVGELELAFFFRG